MKLPSLAPLRHRNFRLFWLMRSFGTLSFQMLATTIGWQVYEVARRDGASVGDAAFLLGLVGLAQFLPLLVTSPYGGMAADRWSRKNILIGYHTIKMVCGLALLATGFGVFGQGDVALIAIFSVAIINGLINAFAPSASQALMPMLVPKDELPAGVALSSLAFSTASIVGPTIAGIAIAIGEKGGGHGAALAYGLAAAFSLLALLWCVQLKPPAQERLAQARAWPMIMEGLAYVGRNKIVLGAISLDLAAVLLAGATALLPVFARDVLNVGPDGLGLMRAAPSVGAAVVALWLAAAPINRRVGPWMFGSVAIFGLATIAFGLAPSLWWALAALVVVGASDMISVYVRQSLVQIATPDAMRGRVASTSFIFISASNELGEFQSGVFAKLMGPVGAVLFGGVGAVAVVAAWIKLFPDLWRMDSFQDAERFAEAPTSTSARAPASEKPQHGGNP
jgi:MFS family permease